MNDDIPFDKNLELAPDLVDEPVPGVRRVMANNPGPFTFKGTVSYILGRGKVAIVDPGPDDPAHVGALLVKIAPLVFELDFAARDQCFDLFQILLALIEQQ